MTLSIITSRVADKDYNKIVGEHADIVQGMNEQQMRVQAYTQQKSQEQQMRDQQNKADADSRADKTQTQALEEKKMAQEAEFRRQDYDMKLMDALK